MIFKPMGIYVDEPEHYPTMNAADFSDRNYTGRHIARQRDGKPVFIMQSKHTTPLMWKVVYGFSTVFFRSFADAVEFCNSRGMELMLEQDKEEEA
ncbi:MAG: hypothetical protein HUJ66_04220 [Oscillospiraceae bacterium]|nr:hypothetical protein [Oscillospiraceae bacterium]